MPIDQQLLVPTLPTSSGDPSITVAELVALMDGETNVAIDQTLLIPTLKGCAGLPAETIAAIVALSSGGVTETVDNLIATLLPSNHWPCNGLVNAIAFNDNGQISPVSLNAINTPTFADSIPMAAEPRSTATLFTAANSEAGASPSAAGDVNSDVLGTYIGFFKLTSLANPVLTAQGNAGGATLWQLQIFSNESIQVHITVNGGANNLQVVTPLLTGLIDDGEWHMVAYRQPGDGSGMNGFFDNTFIANAAMNTVLGGTGDVDWWFADTVATAPSTIMGIASTAHTVRASFLDGSLMHQALFPTVLTNDQLTEIWDQAIANGLNA